MPKSAPNLGDTNWGTSLNAHLSQIMSPATGGVNALTNDPDTTGWTVEETGYTFINTTTSQLKRWNGTSWDILITSGSVGANYSGRHPFIWNG